MIDTALQLIGGGLISISSIFLLFNIITKNITLIGILYLILMILIGVFASILGINKRRT